MKSFFKAITIFLIAGLAAASAAWLAICVATWIYADTPSHSNSFSNRRSKHQFLVYPEAVQRFDKREHHFHVWAVWDRDVFSPEVVIDTRFPSEEHRTLMRLVTHVSSLPTFSLNDFTFTHSTIISGQRQNFSERDVVVSFHPLTLSILFGILPISAALTFVYFRLLPHHWQLITYWARSAATRVSGRSKSRGFDVIVQKDGK